MQTHIAKRILEVADEFSPFGAVSLGLVAWELSLEERNIEPTWITLANQDLIERAGTLPDSDEEAWQLTESGREMITQCDRVTVADEAARSVA